MLGYYEPATNLVRVVNTSTQALPKSAIVLFEVFDAVLTCSSREAVVFINEGGQEQYVPNGSITWRNQQYFLGRIMGNRAVTLNLKTKTITLPATLFVNTGREFLSIIPAQTTLDVSAVYAADPGNSKVCYVDLLDDNKIKFERYHLIDRPESIILFVEYGSSLIAGNPASVVLLDENGQEVIPFPLPANSVSYDKVAYYAGRLLSRRKLTLNLQTKKLTIAGGCLASFGKDFAFLPTGEINFSAQYRTDNVMLGYYDPVTASVGIVNTNTQTVPKSAIVLFEVFDAVLTCSSREAVVYIDEVGQEQYVPNGSITWRSQEYYVGRILGERAVTLNLQTKTVTLPATLHVWTGRDFLSLTPAETTLDVSAVYAADAGGTKVCYVDLLDNNKIKFNSYNLINQPQSVVLFCQYSTTLLAGHATSVVLIWENGREVEPYPVKPHSVDYQKTAYYPAHLLTSQAMTLNLQTKTLTVAGGCLATFGKEFTFLPSGTVDFSAQYDLGNIMLGYYEPATNSVHVANTNTQAVPLSAITLFESYAGGLVCSNRDAIKLIDLNGVDDSGRNSATELTARLLLPDDLYFIADQPLPVYKQSIVSDRTYLNSLRTSIVNKAANKRPIYRSFEVFEVDPASLEGQVSIALTPSWTNNFAYMKAMTVHKRSLADVAGRTTSLLTIGDSLTEGGVATNVQSYLAERGVNVTLIGTKYGKQEGRGSWNIDNFIGRQNVLLGNPITRSTSGDTTTNQENPFLKPATASDKANYPAYCFRNTGANVELSYANDPVKTGSFYIFDVLWYLQVHGKATPDFVSIGLGTNNLWIETAPPELFARMLADLEFMIRRVFEALPAAKLGIIPVPGVGMSDEANTKWLRNYSQWIERVQTKVRELKPTFANLYLVPVWMHMNGEFAFPYLNSNPLSPYNNSQKLQKGDYVHFDPWGYVEYAGPYSAWMVNVM